MSKTSETVCRKCGQCCFFVDDNGIKKPCRFLQDYGRLKLCRVYPNHVGQIVAICQKGVYFCRDRSEQSASFEGCPYNRPQKPEELVPEATKLIKEIRELRESIEKPDLLGDETQEAAVTVRLKKGEK